MHTSTVHTSTVQRSPDIRVIIFGYASPTTGQAFLDEHHVTAAELFDGRFEARVEAQAQENGWQVTHLYRRTPEDVREYEELLKLAVELGIAKAAAPVRALLERFLSGEVTQSLLFALGHEVREGGGHPVEEYALRAAERDVYRVFWRAHVGPVGVHALMGEAETWATMALDWIRA
jgi:hypothetical protein